MLSYDGSNVVYKKELLAVEPFRRIYDNDNTVDKANFQEIITYIYFDYSKESPWRNKFPTDRKKLICIQKLGRSEDYYEHLEMVSGYKEAVAFYIEHNFSEEELFFLSWKEDVDDFLSYLKNIKFQREEEQLIDGVLKKVMIDNSDQKVKAVKHISTMFDVVENIRKRIKEDKETKTTGQKEKKMFEE